jgi:4-aminobutyrate aminotransferase
MVILEPIMGEGGVVVPPPGYLAAVRSLTESTGTLLVLDEVQTGVGRTGHWFACQAEGVAPDIITLAKGIGGGLPLGAIVAPKRMMTWPSGAHANTFGGNPVACAAALATINLLETELLANTNEVGAHMMARLQTWPDRFPIVGEVRGRGLMLGIDLVEDRATRAPAHDLRDQIVDEAFQRGLLLLGAGPGAIRLCPPLILTRELADEGLTILEDLLTAHS